MAYVSRTDSLRRAEGQERHQSPAARCEEWPAQTGVIPAIGQRPAESARDRFAEYREPIPECGHWGTPEPYAVRSVRYDARGFTFRSMTPGWRAGVVGGARSRHAPCKTTKIPRGVAECLRDCLGQRSAIGRSAAHSLSPRIERPVLSTLRCTPLPVGTRGWYGAYPTTHGSPLPMNHRSRCVVNAAREPLHGEVEIDDTWVGGPQAGLRGSRQLKGRKTAIVVAAVENRGGVSGRIRMAVIPNFKQTTMIAFIKHHVSPGSTVHTDGLKGFEDLQGAGVTHVRRTQPRPSALRKGAASVVPLADRAIGKPPAVADRHVPWGQ